MPFKGNRACSIIQMLTAERWDPTTYMDGYCTEGWTCARHKDVFKLATVCCFGWCFLHK